MFRKVVVVSVVSFLFFILTGCGDNSNRLPQAQALNNPASSSQASSGLMTDKNVPEGDLPNKRTTRIKTGNLQGKTVIISPGHGYFKKPGYWTTQRGVTNGLIEDMHTNEMVMDFLIPYLTRAGAYVYSCRERSRQSEEVIVDNDQGSPSYTETGNWSTSSSSGYQGKSYRYAATAGSESATATFRPNIPKDGYYPVYIYYRASSNRAPDALFRVNHTGGTTDFKIDQRKNNQRWLYLGEFYFEKGTEGSVVLSNTSSSGGVVIADAVRFGGGIGPSGHPRWQECAKVWTDYVGAPTGSLNDVVARGHYADWQGGDLYLSIHTNAGGGTGTSSFIHSYQPSAGSAAYRKIVHDQLVNDVRALVDPNWVDRGKKTANFGELRTTQTMPAMLFEVAFHDLPEDAEHLKAPQFRHIVTRAMYKGMAEYLTGNDHPSPLAPTHLVAKNSGKGQVTLSWKPQTDPIESKAAPASYIVYTSNNGYGFDNGVKVTGTSTTIKNLTPGALYYFKVTAVNGGGESLDSETLAIRITPNGESPGILLVSGFDRLDKRVTVRYQENTFNYGIQHGRSLAAEGYFFESASNEAVISGEVDLKNYKVVDWILGEESTADETFSTSEQSLVSDYLNHGGSLLISGSEIAWDLGNKGSKSDGDFLKSTLKASYVKDASGTYEVKASSQGAFSSLSPFKFDNGKNGIYNVDYADVIKGEGGATTALTYSNGGAAAIQHAGQYKLLYLAFPLEAIYNEPDRNKVMAKAIEFLK